MTWELVLGVLPWLLLLACPLSMLFMMRGQGHSCSSKGSADEAQGAAAAPARSEDDELRILRERLARLEAKEKEAQPWTT